MITSPADRSPLILASGLSHAAVGEYAERVGREHGIYNDRGRADTNLLMASLGATRKPDDSRLFLTVRGIGDLEISRRSFTSDRRRRFAIAHAIAHYFLHYRRPGLTGIREFYVNVGARALTEAEAFTEANVFASALLMPAAEFSAAYAEHGGDEWQLGTRFSVSPLAAQTRAAVLSLSKAAA